MSIKGNKLPRSGNVSPEFALLGFLLGGPQHGYDLHRRFTTDLGHVWHLSQSQAYAILRRLENQGSVTSRQIPQRKLPPRQVLQLTRLGRRRFNDWLENGVGANARSIRLEFLTRLYFAQRFRPRKVSQICRVQRAEVQDRIVRLQETLAQLPRDQVFNRLSLELRQRQMQLILQWIDRVRQRISRRELVR